MPARKPQPSASRARLTVLAAADDSAFLAYALELLRSKQRLDREAALEAFVDRPLADAREPMHRLYLDLHADRPKSDHGAIQRAAIVRCLIKQPHPTDAQIAVLASETYEKDSMREDNTYNLRLLGLRLLAHVIPADIMRYYAVEHLDDVSPHKGEPAATAMRLLGETGNFVAIYQWLLGDQRESPNLLVAFEALADGPPEIVARYVATAIDTAIALQDETACTVFAESIVKLEIEQAYPALARMMTSRVSDELFAYLAMLLAATNRPPLLAILEGELRLGGRTKLIIDALRVRTTPEQQAVLDRWEARD